jgi:hypothetical protein
MYEQVLDPFGVRDAETRRLIESAFKHGLQTPAGKLALASMLAGLNAR